MIMGEGTNDYIVVMFQVAVLVVSSSMGVGELLGGGLRSPRAALV